jgi:hypothetical protein
MPKTKNKTGMHRNSLIVIVCIILHFFLIQQSNAQNYTVTGKITDSKSKEALAFVSIKVNNLNQAYTSDIDGNFAITSTIPIKTLLFSYVGYENMKYEILQKYSSLKIELTKKEIQLSELVIFPSENPAHRIIYNVISNRDKNNPEKLNSYSYSAYNKMIFTANSDSLKKDTTIVDSNYIKTKAFLEKQHLFMMESVSKKSFLYPDKVNEKLIATKISGFKDPLFAMIVTQMQSFSFYNDYISIMDKNYLNPISKDSPSNYFFLLEDTLYQAKDSVFIISFRPRKNKNFDALKGLLYINTNGWAIQNVIAEPAFEEEGGVGVKIQQKYELVDSVHWFPSQLNSDLIFKNVSLNNVKLVGEGRTYIKDIVLNPELKKSAFSNVEVEVVGSGNSQNDSIWKKFRTDSLSEKELRTYAYIDSLGKKAHFDRSIRMMEALMSGKIPVKSLDLDINRLVAFNDYEGFRLGIGLQTSKKISKWWVLGGYFAYGCRDKAFKYGGDAEYFMRNAPDVSFGLAYSDDLIETGSVRFYESNPLIAESSFRKFLLNSFDQTLKKEAFLKFTAFKYFKIKLNFALTNKVSTDDYAYGIVNENVTVLRSDFDFTEFGVGICYNYKEKFVKSSDYKLSLGSKYPAFYLTYTRGIKGLLIGDFNYNRFDFKTTLPFTLKNIGKPTFTLIAGYIDVSLPRGNLYSGLGSFRPFTIAAPMAFATMRMNEFLSDRYAACFFTHDFGKLLKRNKNFNPALALAYNVGIGSLNNRDVHRNSEFNTMEKGYSEAGIQLNNLLSTGFYGLGIAAYYRIGYYTKPDFKENVAYKFTLKLYF